MSPSDSVENRIATVLDSLSQKQKRLARFVLDSKYFMSFASASQAGEKTRTSAATVVRFAQTLGYQGYSELQAAIRAELPSYLTAAERIQARLSTEPPSDNTPQQVFHTDIRNIERSANNLESSKLEAAMQEILQAENIFVIGSGLSAAPALYLAHSLKVMGFDCRAVINGGLSLAADLAHLGPGKLIIAIDLWRYVRSTVAAVSAGQDAGVHTIAITDSIVSPLANLADYAFEVATDGVAHSLSVTAATSLINVFVAVLSQKVPEQTMEALRRVDAAYRANDLLIME